MTRLSGRTRTRFALLVAFLLMTSTVVVAFAMNVQEPSRASDGVPLYSAFTEFEMCDGPGACSVVEVSLSSSWDGDGTVLCVTSTIRQQVERGCAIVNQSFGPGGDAITWADIPETRIDLYETRCNDGHLCGDVLTRTMAIEGLWAGEGETMHFDRSFGRHYGACTWPDNIGGVVRTASLVLLIDGDPVRAYGNIRLVESTNVPTTTCAGLDR